MNISTAHKFGAAVMVALSMALTGCLTDDKGDEDGGPTISISPIDVIVDSGAVASFTLTASGSGTLRYQWMKDGVNRLKDTLVTLTFIAHDSDDAAAYTCKVTDKNGSTTSTAGFLRIRVTSKNVTLGAQDNALTPSSLDLDAWATYPASTAKNNSNAIDIVFAYSTSTGNDSLALYSPIVAKNGVGGSGGFTFMADWPSANSTDIRVVQVAVWNNVVTAADIKALYDAGTSPSPAGRVFVKAGTTIVARSNLGLYVLLRVTSVTLQSATGAGVIDAKAKW